MMEESFVSKNRVGIYLREKGVRVSSEFIPQLDAKVKEILDAAIKRMQKNGRSTVMMQDL